MIQITGSSLNYENPDQMLIEDLIKANLLRNTEEIEDITDSADK